jgi:hypothetical protein
MNSGFFGEQNIRDMKITAGIISVIFASLLTAFFVYHLFNTFFASIVALPLYATLIAYAIFGPQENRMAIVCTLGGISLFGLIVGGLMKVEATTYQSIFSSIWNFIKGLICLAIVLILIVGVANAWWEDATTTTTSSTFDRTYGPDESTSYEWDDEDDDGLIHKVDDEILESLIDALNEDEIDPFDIEMLIDDGAKNARISFRYKKPQERARRRKVIVKKIDGECLGCIDLSDRSYKNFRLDRISDARHA